MKTKESLLRIDQSMSLSFDLHSKHRGTDEYSIIALSTAVKFSPDSYPLDSGDLNILGDGGPTGHNMLRFPE